MKKRILHITPQAPGEKSGGEIAVHQTLLSFLEDGYIVDYVGPQIESEVIKKKYNHIYELDKTNNVILRCYDLLHGITNSRYRSWNKLKLDINLYDNYVLEFTKLDYVVDKLDKKKLIVRAHNIEYDYAYRDYINDKKITKFIIMHLAKKQEKKILGAAEKIVFITAQDKKRAHELYGIHKNEKVIPVCIEAPEQKILNEKIYDNSKIRLLITGSLWFGENYNGIIWFVKNVLPKLQCKYFLTIAGFHPTEELIKMQNSDVQIIDSPESMEEYFKNADLFVAPIFNGSGMKVKVAQSLSYALPVVGTSHAFEGYLIHNAENSFRANTDIEFAKAIDFYSHLSDDVKLKIRNNAYETYLKNYDIHTSSVLWKNVIEG